MEVAVITGDDAPAISVGDMVVRIGPRYFRPAEVKALLGDPSKPKEKLGYVSGIAVQGMCAELVAEDLKSSKRHRSLKDHGLELPLSYEE